MSAAQVDRGLAQKFTDGTKSLPRKRKQGPDHDLAVPSTPSKASKRVKGETLSPVNQSPKQSSRSRSHSQKKEIRDVTYEPDWEPQEDGAPRAVRKTSKTQPEAQNNGQVNLDEASVVSSVKKTSRTEVKVGGLESTAVDTEYESATPSKRKTKSRRNLSDTINSKEIAQDNEEAVSKKPNRRRKTEAGKETEATPTLRCERPGTSPKTKTTSKAKAIETVDLELDRQGDEEVIQKTRRKRKTKEEKAAEAMPLAARTAGLRMFIGAHVSIATGVEKAVTNCVHIGGNAFALFLQSQRKWDNKPLLEENRLAFMSMCEEHNYNASDHVLPHGSYLVNLAQEDKDRAKQAYDHFLDDLKRCEALGIKMYNFHPGAAGKAPLDEAINRISAQLNRALAETQTAVPLLENMASSGSVIGSRFTDLRDIIAGIKPEYRSRIGVCIDTCHAFAAGYDLRTPEAFKKTMQEFDSVVGMKYLKALHVNDSKAPFGSHRDLHQNIGMGFLGLRAFHNVMNEPRFHNMPLILETPCDRIDPSDPTGKKVIDDKSVWASEIKLLESLIGMDPTGDEFKQLEQELSEKGRASREKVQNAIDEKNKKAKKKLEKSQRRLVDLISKKEESTDSSLSELSDDEHNQ